MRGTSLFPWRRHSGSRWRRDLKIDLVLPNHPQVRTRPLFQRFESGFKITNFGIKGASPCLDSSSNRLLRVDLLLKVANPEPTTLAKPKRILKRDQTHGENQRKEAHG